MDKRTVYVVTGATRGIGRAVASRLAARGLHVLAVGRSTQRLASLAAQGNGYVTAVAADLAIAADIAAVKASVPAGSSGCCVVHAAGSLVPLEPYDRLDPDALVEHFRIHVAAPIALYQSLQSCWRIERMLFIDSYSASAVRQGWPAYSIVKSAAQMAAKCAREELPQTRSVRVFPGAVNTQIVAAVLASNTETAATFAGMLERGEFAEPDEVAGFIAALLVDASDALLTEREAFDYNCPEDRQLVDQR